MLHKDINSLDERMQSKALKAFNLMQVDDKLKSLGVTSIAINETRRDIEVQMAYYSRGRMTIPDVIAMYKAAGLYALTKDEATRMITWTLDSKHIKGLAIDIVPMKGSVVWWTAPAEIWERMGELGESVGLTWGGRWKNNDSPHYELPGA